MLPLLFSLQLQGPQAGKAKAWGGGQITIHFACTNQVRLNGSTKELYLDVSLFQASSLCVYTDWMCHVDGGGLVHEHKGPESEVKQLKQP